MHHPYFIADVLAVQNGEIVATERLKIPPALHDHHLSNFYVHTVHLYNYQSFFHQMMHNWIVLKTILNLH